MEEFNRMVDNFVTGLSQVCERINQFLDCWASDHGIKVLLRDGGADSGWAYVLDTGWTVERLAPFYQMNEWERADYLLDRYAEPFMARIAELPLCSSVVRLHPARSRHCICALGADVRIWLPLQLPVAPTRSGHILPAGIPRVQETL